MNILFALPLFLLFLGLVGFLLIVVIRGITANRRSEDPRPADHGAEPRGFTAPPEPPEQRGTGVTPIVVATIAALVLIGAATIGVNHVLETKATVTARAVLAERMDSLAEKRQHWRQADRSSIAAEGTREEALRTLDMLQQLYAQEERLWQYLEALDAQQATRSQLVEERAELERRVAEHRRQLEQLDASLDGLRPPEDEDEDIRFSEP